MSYRASIWLLAGLSIALLAFSWTCIYFIAPVWAAQDYWLAWTSGFSLAGSIICGTIATIAGVFYVR